MIKIKFNDSQTFYEAKFRRTSEHLITINGDIPSNTSGFKIYSGDTQLGDYSDFTTIYKEFEGGKVFSNDGSVEPRKEMTIYVEWEGGGEIPTYVSYMTNLDRGKLLPPNWSKTYEIGEHDIVYLTSCSDIPGFEKVMSDVCVIYKYTGEYNE